MFISFLRTIILYIIIVVTLRVLGKRQVGELEPSELVVAILISDLAAVPMQDIGIPMLSGIIPIVTLLLMEIIASDISMKSIKFRALLCGKPVFIIRDGVIDQNAMRNNRLTVDELFCCLRQQGILNIQQVQYAVLETNGQLSTFLYPIYAPSTQYGEKYPEEKPAYPVTVICDGRILEDNLKVIGQELDWLSEELKKHNTSAEDVFLMTATSGQEVFLVKQEEAS